MKFECYYAGRHKSLEFLTEPFACNNIDHTLPYPILFNNNIYYLYSRYSTLIKAKN